MALPTASDNVFPKIIHEEVSAPSTPASGTVVSYAKADGLMYSKDDAGTETLMSAGASGNPVATNATVATGENTTSTSFADLSTPGPSVTVTVGASGKVLLHVSARISNTNANVDCYVGVDISGASTVAATTLILVNSAAGEPLQFGTTVLLTGLSAGSTTFKMQYAVAANTGSFSVRELVVELRD